VNCDGVLSPDLSFTANKAIEVPNASLFAQI